MQREKQKSSVAVVIAIVCAIVISGCRVSERPASDTPAQKPVPALGAQTVAQELVKGAGNPDCPATVSLLRTMPSKPPLIFYQFKIRLMKRQPGPGWFVLRHSDPLPGTGRFNCEPSTKQCFSAEELSDPASPQSGKMVVIRFFGTDSFTAIRVPEGADITSSNYILNTAEPIPEFEVWEVDSLLINGKTPLEQWVPYAVMSDRLVRIGERPKITMIDWDATTHAYRQDFPKEKVEFVSAQAIRKWLAPIASSERKTPQ